MLYTSQNWRIIENSNFLKTLKVKVMKKFILIFVILVLGCSRNDQIEFTRTEKTVKLKITHSAQIYEIKTAEEAKFHKDKLQKIIKEIENFEYELSIMEKQ